MSLILEALKKSEAERRIGQAPGLLTPVAAASAPPPGRRWWLLLVVAVVLVMLLAAAWWLGRRGGDGESATASNATAVVAAAPESTKPVPSPSASSSTAEPTAAPISQRANSSGAQSVPIPSRPQTRDPQRSADASTGERESASVAPFQLPAPVEAPRSQPAPSAPAAAVPPAPATTATQPPTTAAAPEPRLPLLRELSSAERAELPPLRLSMHVYSDDPDGRFVLIDNHRYGEGASVADGLQIIEIRNDGVVMEFHGHRFLLDRPG